MTPTPWTPRKTAREAPSPTWERRIELGDGKALVFHPNNVSTFEHECKTVVDVGPFVVAPKLHPQHEVIRDDPLTIIPSILCLDCGTHGWVREGRWWPA